MHTFSTLEIAESNNMVGEIPPEIGVLVHMTSFISFFNSISGPIPSALGLIKPLETFDVESNKMSGDLFQPNYVGPDGLTNMVNFRASANNFQGSVPTEIGTWTKLQNLWFADNEITGTIPSEVGNLVNMGELCEYMFLISCDVTFALRNVFCNTNIDFASSGFTNRCVSVLQEQN